MEFSYLIFTSLNFQCGKVSMMTLTLARYILELALMDYSTIELSDSKMACAALFIALRMNHMDGWNATFEYYSGNYIRHSSQVFSSKFPI
jgi:hypothetical protein